MLTYHYYWLEAMALGYALTELRIFPMGKTQGEKENQSTRKKCAFFLAKANNLAAIEFGKSFQRKRAKRKKGTSKSRLLVRKEKPESKEVWFTYGGRLHFPVGTTEL